MKKTVLVLALGALLGALVLPVAAQGARDILGAYLSHESEERIDIAVGATRSGDYVRPDRLVLFRDAVVVPEHYGTLVSVTSSGESAVLWYVSEDGDVRNVILPDGMVRTYRIEKNGSRLVADIRKPF
jgi:hypothetical protein